MTDFTDMIDGYRRFRTTGWAQQRERWTELNEGQSPRVMVIACSDSRSHVIHDLMHFQPLLPQAQHDA